MKTLLTISITLVLISCASTHNLAKYKDYVMIHKEIVAPNEWHVVIKNDEKIKEFNAQTWFVNHYQIGDTIK